MSIQNSTTGEVLRSYSIDELKQQANLMRGYDLAALCAAGFGTRRRHALHHGHHRRALPSRRQPRSQESLLARPRSHRLVDGPQGAQPLSRPRLRRILPERRRRAPAQALFAVSGASALAQAARRRSLHRIAWPGPEHRRRHGARRQAWTRRITTSSASWATASSRKARSGKRRWKRATSSSTT